MRFRGKQGAAFVWLVLLMSCGADAARAQAPEPSSTPGWTAAPPLDSPDPLRVWAEAQAREQQPPAPTSVWGIAGVRGYAYGQQIAPNGLEYNPLFSLDLDFNLMLWREEKVYLFTETRFWGQKAGGGATNPSQGAFDFSKRELDFTLGVAWNYCSFLEARAFSYSLGNLNRGKWGDKPSGFNDGVGLENRWYLHSTYADLGTAAFDTARASFVSIGYCPTKDLTDNEGLTFKPGAFARAYLIYDVWGENYYVFLDAQLTTRRPINPKLFSFDAGLAGRPFAAHPRLEFRLGSENTYDRQWNEWESSFYGAIRFVF